MKINVPLPIKGIFKGTIPGKEPENTSPYMNNVRPVDVNVKRIRIGQRPGLDKWSSTQVGDASNPVVAICSVSSIT